MNTHEHAGGLTAAWIATVASWLNTLVGGNYVTTADDAVTLTCDGTNGFEPGARSINGRTTS